MSSHKKNRCVCQLCHKGFRSKEKFKKVCGECSKKNENTNTEKKDNLRV